MATHRSSDYSRSRNGVASTSSANYDGRYSPLREDLGADGDKPPDHHMHFSKLSNTTPYEPDCERIQLLSPRDRKPSLLTQALTSPELGPLSDIEAPVLTSDGGMTSPARTNTPSPPLPTLRSVPFDPIVSKEVLEEKHDQEPVKSNHELGLDRTQEVKVEEELGRRRCISFACLQKSTSQASARKPVRDLEHRSTVTQTPAAPPKRPCMLRFACPMKPDRVKPRDDLPTQRHEDSGWTKATSQVESAGSMEASPAKALPIDRVDHDSPQKAVARSASKVPATGVTLTNVSNQDRISQFNRIDFQKCEATRFHEFAGSLADEGEWANEQTAFRQKITINDTLRKENAIRKLAEEAEEEARDEEENFSESEVDALDEVSDDGNESDDEEGFADSDDDSDSGSAYQFWTPGLNTATTSTDNIEHFRSASRTKSESSVESVVEAGPQTTQLPHANGRDLRSGGRSRKQIPPNPSELPDSSDFVVGTIDEDQCFEQQYLSRMKEKERAKQKLIPQDIDPSFPTSDPDGEEDDDDDVENLNEGEEEDNKSEENCTSPAPEGVQSSADDDQAERPRSPSANRAIQSPRRLHSPPPSRRLFGQATHHFRSPPPLHRKLMSPPSSRRPSFSGSPDTTRGISIARLGQRPNLTHTASLPRTPNPFWYLHDPSENHKARTPSAGTSPRTSFSINQEYPRRGPIEIVQGLQNRRQRRKEKMWRQQCSRAHAGKEKERRCHPGKGAQRMREVGLVMADRFKGYKQDTKLVLSV